VDSKGTTREEGRTNSNGGAMSVRNIWHYELFKLGEIIVFQGQRYKVIRQEKVKRDTAFFKGVYYTMLASMKGHE